MVRRDMPRERHGMAGKPVYRSWQAMKSRCYNKNNQDYLNYHGKGIKVCDEWVNSFINFYEDMGDHPRLSGRVTLERVDNTKGYSKENCCWATDREQARNRSKRSENTSGVTGVSIMKRRGVEVYWMSNWTDLSGKSKFKSFSIKRLGSDVAFKLACKHRLEMIKYLNTNDEVQYSTHHGK